LQVFGQKDGKVGRVLGRQGFPRAMVVLMRGACRAVIALVKGIGIHILGCETREPRRF
jgi:hypothetical protein